MAREYARYLTRTHTDIEWSELSTMHHDCYMAILSSPGISWAGVVPYLPSRYSSLASDLTDRKVARVWDDLERHGLLVIDKRAGEVIARTFVRYDNVIAKPNLTKALISSYGLIRSNKIREALIGELVHLARDKPNLSGWQQFEELLPELFEELLLDQLEA